MVNKLAQAPTAADLLAKYLPALPPPAAAPCAPTDSPDVSDPLDRALNFARSRLTLGLSPASIAQAYIDWATHLAASPGKQLFIAEKAMRKWVRLAHYVATRMPSQDQKARCIEPLPHDRRFDAPEWKSWPFDILEQAFLLQQQWCHNATVGVRGVTRKHEQQVEFLTRQLLDVFSPANFLFTNPEVLRQTFVEGGQNLVRGYWNFIEDTQRVLSGSPPVGTEGFVVGENVAATPGEIVYRNELIELIRYNPTTDTLHPEPVLIIPAWIMKYYILDLSPHNSLVKHLLDQGFTVYMISWKNPTSADRDLGMDDYLRLGAQAATDMVRTTNPGQKIHAVGYCLGGTLLSILAATAAGNNNDSFKTLTLFAAQVDFTDPGELSLFIDESQVSFLEDMMWHQGYLDARQMAGAFQLLRSNDLIWSRLVHDYLMGQRSPMSDLMAWNADSTHLPYRMHSEYLRRLFLDNDLAAGRYCVNGRRIALTDIRVPVFAVGTERDHVAPWKSVFKLNLLLDTDVTFLLTSGGHNAGIVSEPGRKGRHYRVRTKHERDSYIDPDNWLDATPVEEGSWWPIWVQWLADHSASRQPRAKVYRPIPSYGPAPGDYVQR